MIKKLSSLFTSCCCLWLVFIMPQKLNAQSLRNIKGIVIDETTKETLPGAVLKIRGSNRSTTTNEEGAYTIKGITNEIIEISYLGYLSKNIAITNSNTLNISLSVDNKALKEVIVIGYGSTTKADATGSISTVSMDDLVKAPVASFEEALAGRVAGVTASASDGQPGEALNITIRGGNSLTQSNAPLYVIDGFPIEDPDNAAINPEDIESMTILKDASATAIYGARGANGVIIIETKKGKVGAPVISFNNSIGVQSPQKLIDVMSPYEFVKYQSELDSDLATQLYFRDGRTLESYRNVKPVNWQEEIFRTTLNRIHNIAVRGGTAQTKYNISGNIYGQDGIILNSGYNRYQGRVNIDQTVNKKLKIGLNTNYSKRITDGTAVAEGEGTSFTTYLLSRAWSFRPVTGNVNLNLIEEDVDEETIDQFNASFNPVVTTLNAYNKSFITDFLANVYADYALTKNLQLRITGSVNSRSGRTEAFYNSKTPRGTTRSAFNTKGVNAGIGFNESLTLSNENTLTYTKVFNKVHKFTALGGFSLQEVARNSYGYTTQQIPNENLGMSGMDAGNPLSTSALQAEFSLVSAFTRLNYSYKSKYLLTATLRSDASSKFAKQNRASYFPSVAAGWSMHEESWFKNIGFINQSKLRASYGLTGNNRISEYTTYPSLINSFPASYSWGNGTPQLASIVSTLGNQDIKWETTEQMDLGWDLSMFKSKINLTVDIYRKNTRDLLLNALLPSTTGFASAFKNIGSVRNEGLEITLSTENFKTKKFSWYSDFNISFNRNKVLALAEGQEKFFATPSFETQYNANPLYISEIGKPVGMFYGYIWEGVYNYEDFNNPSEGVYVLKPSVSRNGTNNVQPGDIKYRDINGDGTIDPQDLTVLGRGLPIHTGGFNNNLNYGNFSLNVFFQWSYGNQIYNANRLMFEGNGNVRANLNQFASYVDRWSPENPTSTNFRARGQGVTGYHSDRVLEDGSYLRLKTLSLSYNIPKKYMSKTFLNTLNLGVAAQNLITWTNYTGMDPEVSVRRSALTPGFDFSAYPIARTIVFTLKSTF